MSAQHSGETDKTELFVELLHSARARAGNLKGHTCTYGNIIDLSKIYAVMQTEVYNVRKQAGTNQPDLTGNF